MYKNSLFIGRFQPFHLGYLSAVEKALDESDFLYIGIGSAEQSFQPENPFTAAERWEMINGTLKELAIPPSRYAIIPVRNINNYPLWVNHVRTYIPDFQTIYTGSPIVKKLFKKSAPEIIIEKVPTKYKINATEVREAILKEENLTKLLPPAVIEYLQNIDAYSRLKDISVLN